ILTFSKAYSQSNRVLDINVTDEIGIPLDSVLAKVSWTTGKIADFICINGLLQIPLNEKDSVLIKLSRESDFLNNDIIFSYSLANEKNLGFPIEIKLKAMSSIYHGFHQLKLNKTYATDRILDLPDTFSFYDNPLIFLHHKLAFVQVDSIDSDIYTLILNDPNNKILIQDSSYNQRLKVNLKEFDFVTLTIGEKLKTYSVTGYETYRGFE